MPRPRTVENEAIFLAVARVIGQVGPTKLTLARIAKEAGLAAPTLVQRFGSKTGLLRAMSKAARGESGMFVDGLRAKERSPAALVREFLLCFAGMAPSPEVLTNHTLAYLQLDLADPVMRRQLVASGLEQAEVLEGLIRQAVDAGEFERSADPATLARILPRLVIGSLLAWGLHRTGAARDWLARDVDAVLAPHRPVGPSRSNRPTA
ncbi:MAG: TetR/AcrR family transcriptional regulator [Gemmatimonadales bacterium]